MANNLKETNPKDYMAANKPSLTSVPMNVLMEVSVALMEGSRKYGRHNYRESGAKASVYLDGAFRHLSSWWEGQDIDPDSGVNHITKAIASLIVVRDCMLRGNMEDDRPPKSELIDYSDTIKEIKARYPNGKDPYTQTNNKEMS